jgi:hypothetical protein
MTRDQLRLVLQPIIRPLLLTAGAINARLDQVEAAIRARR